MTPALLPVATRARRRALVALWVLLLALLPAAVGCSPAGSGPTDGPTSGQRSADATGEAGEYAVGWVERTFVDESRGTAAHDGVAARSSRELPTLVVYPAAGAPGEPEQDARRANGSFPLVVLSHGRGGGADRMAPLATLIAAQGYVVAVPTYPLSSIPVTPTDVANQPEDVSFLLDRLLAAQQQPLAGVIDDSRIAVAGTSLGAITSIGVAFHDRLRDGRIDAVVAYAGARIELGPGGYTDPPPLPLLLVHGEQDEVLDIEESRKVLESATGPTYLLAIEDVGHVDLFTGEAGTLLVQVTEAFLDTYLGEDPDAMAQVPELVADSGIATLRSRNTP